MAGSTPRLELSTQRLDLGDGKPNEELHGELVVTNRFAEPLDFSVTTTCGCMKPKPVKGSIEPGGRQTIELGIKLPGHANSEKNATATIHTTTQRPDDPLPEAMTCAVLARCPAPFNISPAYVDFGTASREKADDLNQEVRVQSVPGKPTVSTENLQVEHDQRAFQVATSTADDGAVLLRVSLARDLPYGDHYDTVELHLAGSDYVMRVPLHARLAEPVTIVPAKVFLRKDPKTGRFRPVTVLVISRAPAGAVGPVRLVGGPTGMLLEDRGAARATQRRVCLSAEGELAPFESVLRLAADGVENELSLKLVVKP
ncbi:MAG TPA: DUF1573 domain-containing protein [Pirellulales bacterium]|nr:DUF1573 domain-containing protein [Pirellulales bacterium]